jgi:hypothetical protein
VATLFYLDEGKEYSLKFADICLHRSIEAIPSTMKFFDGLCHAADIAKGHAFLEIFDVLLGGEGGWRSLGHGGSPGLLPVMFAHG